ncbi:sporulation protein, partial [Bacillus sp. WP8]|uniref:sporulation protein n=1 Tax=Bacillus sp. WP8 TaxID=756828 RepID=UPI00164271C0
ISFFKNLPPTARIPPAKLHTILHKNPYFPPQQLHPTLHLNPPKIPHDIPYINLNIQTHYLIVKHHQHHTKYLNIFTLRLTDSFTIHPPEKHEFPFSF